jgi:hypothetical protein
VFTKEEEENATKQMVREFFERMDTNCDDFYWVGSQIDLMELVYIIWQQDVVRDGFGHPSSLKALTRDLFDRLHTPEPYNLYTVAKRAAMRKGIHNGSLTNRYCWLLYVKKDPQPLDDEIIQLSKINDGKTAV